ncbi:hypothetical protein T492DRAFT_843328 [Pavlovales sp. CCMP2436]|nr:hypothetical protein T492DRAFT_843328 [Pavlovales sp. CCMP2436]
MHFPIYEGIDLTPHIGIGITFSPTSTIHSYQGITFEGGKLYLDLNMIGEGLVHRTEKARQFGLARSAGHGAIEEYLIGDGRYIAGLAIFDAAVGKLIKVVEVVVTSPPSREKLAYYEELGIECEMIVPPKKPDTKPDTKATMKATNPSPPPMFSLDDSDED